MSRSCYVNRALAAFGHPFAHMDTGPCCSVVSLHPSRKRNVPHRLISYQVDALPVLGHRQVVLACSVGTQTVLRYEKPVPTKDAHGFTPTLLTCCLIIPALTASHNPHQCCPMPCTAQQLPILFPAQMLQPKPHSHADCQRLP